ncbi:hypothetical protein [Wenzhouxiangella sediminis]|uniref:Uncharacterized protein n=1 Tax=Wenzhouxiangella sediminis TaxID=1792836 RepID=A0A3E1K602_9GAMM|nr:hypothetical protein [Wenzhouxiangella sediminis]RFF29366.1 hypothetical protein DZC52_13020 [Wenzhouxiangella sediminis]
MSDNTHKLLSSLAEDPETLERFKKDPEGVMKEYGVPEDHQKLILSGDKEKLADEAGIDHNKLQFIII